MAIWRPIQTGAAGFLSLLGLKNLGKNPDAIGDLVQPTIDMQNWWMRGSAQQLFANRTLAAASELWQPAGFNATEREWLNIQHASIWLSMAAPGTNDGVQFVIRNATQTLYLGEIQKGVVLTGSPALAIVNVRDLWVPPGFSFGAYLAGTIADVASMGASVVSVQV